MKQFIPNSDDFEFKMLELIAKIYSPSPGISKMSILISSNISSPENVAHILETLRRPSSLLDHSVP